MSTCTSTRVCYEVEVTSIIAGKNTTKGGVTEVERARKIAASLGVRTAARYLALRHWSIDAARYILLGC